MKILVVSSCTGSKKFKPSNQLTCEEFLDPELLKKREQELKRYILPAFEMYTGRQHLHVKEAMEILWNKHGKENAELWILSAGYGLIPSNKIIAPYECTFMKMGKKEIEEMSRKLKIGEKFNEIIEGKDKVFILLGNDYMKALGFPRDLPEEQEFVIFGGESIRKILSNQVNIEFVRAGNKQAKQNRCPSISLKGKLFLNYIENI